MSPRSHPPARARRSRLLASPLAVTVARLLVVVVTLVVAAPAHAQHDHHHHDGAAPTAAAPAPPPFEVGLTAVAGRFDQELYAGDYAGLTVAVGWRHGRLGVRAALPAYHLRKNGAAVDGLGDVGLAVDVVALQRGRLATGAGLSVTLPTGDMMTGLGMGHVMAMPMAWLSWSRATTTLGASAGWGGALAADASHHAHGPWPLVEPMTSSEIMGDVRVERALTGRLGGLIKATLAMPLQGDATRVTAALGARWRGPQVETGAELQAGIAGDPFTVRAVVTSAVRF